MRVVRTEQLARAPHVRREDVMSVTFTRVRVQPPQARVDLVDSWHKDWPKVLRAVEGYADRSCLRLNDAGWLSARQNLLVAFVDGQPAAHVCFHIEPTHRASKSERACVEAKLDSYGIDPKFCGKGIEGDLRKAALERANMLRCQKLHGFDLKEKWC